MINQKKIIETFNCPEWVAGSIISYTQQYKPEAAMRKINKLLDENSTYSFHGVEAITLDDQYELKGETVYNRHYWGDCVFLYCNSGDTYSPTIGYDVNKEEFLITSWGDWYEENVKEINNA